MFTGRKGIALTGIAFTSNRDGNGTKELYLMDYDGFGQRAISAHRTLSFSPAWAPNGAGISYVSYFEGTPSIYWVELATGQKRSVVSDDRLSMSPSFSPDGRQSGLLALGERQQRALLCAARRLAAASPDQLPRHRHQPCLVAQRSVDRLHVEPLRLASDLRHGRRRQQSAARHLRRQVQRRRLLVARRLQARLRPPHRRRPALRHRRRRSRQPRGNGLDR